MLQHWLTPVTLRTSEISEKLKPYQIGKSIRIYKKRFPSLRTTKIALVGTDEEDMNAVREALYTLSFDFGDIEITDIGTFKKNDPDFIIPVLKELIASHIIPIFVSRDPLHVYTQYLSYPDHQKGISMVTIDERIRHSESHALPEENYLDRILDRNETNLFHLSILGYQSFYANTELVDDLTFQDFNCIRLGDLRANIHETEPLLRDADMLSFHISSMQSPEAPGQHPLSPNGLSGVESCTLAQYSGASDKLSSFGIYGYKSEFDARRLTAQNIAQMIWYFFRGFATRTNDFPISLQSMVAYQVTISSFADTVTFLKSTRSEKWWIAVPDQTPSDYDRHKLVPCSEYDYEMACKQEVTTRLMQAWQRFSG